MPEHVTFPDLRKLFAKANEEKSGDQLAGLAAGSERERVAPRSFSDNIFGSRVKHDFRRALETATVEGCHVRRFSHPRFSDGHGTAIAANELDGRTRPSKHDGSARDQSAPSGPERE